MREKTLYKFAKEMKFDIVSAQFAIHYMFEKEEKLRGFLNNVSKRMAEGAKFIGTTVDSERVVARVRESGKESNLTIGNEYYSIIFG